MININVNDLKTLDRWVSELPYTERKIENCRRKLDKATTQLEKDRINARIKSYENFIETCDRVRGKLSKLQREAYDVRYTTIQLQTWIEVAHDLHISERQAYRIRHSILALFAEEIGML